MELVWDDAEGTEQRLVLRGSWTRIGRSMAADVVLDDPEVSRRHALIVRSPDGFRLQDAGSVTGVLVNGERVDWHLLADGDELTIGDHVLQVVGTAPPVGAATGAALADG